LAFGYAEIIGMGFLIIVPLVLLAGIGIRMFAGSMDHERIKDYIRENGGRVLDVRWTPFGPGWFGEKSDRIYSVRYLDREGNEHEAHAKTSLLTGVYLTNDQIVRSVQPAPTSQTTPEAAALAAENQRLRQELARIKERLGDDRG
jgi:hypothetical protein